jgi:ABC-2 type transport system ATP-binding protein
MEAISVSELTKTYHVPVRAPGLKAAFGSLIRRRFREVHAVRSLTFAVPAGEVVGFLGPNGAGKTTTLKMLAGILRPTAGRADVLGFRPWKREDRFLRQIAMVRGSRPLGVPIELTVSDALRFQRLIYQVQEDQFKRSVGELTELLDLGPLLQRQIRALSLGERMRAGLASSLLYRPQMLFLDEPTIGLDVAAADVLRRFIADYSRQVGATVLLTSHDMGDVETLCRRIILIDHGTLVYDGQLAQLSARLAPYKLLRITTAGTRCVAWERYGVVDAVHEAGAELRVEREDIPAVTARLLADLPVSDLTIEDPPLERVIATIYREGVAA